MKIGFDLAQTSAPLAGCGWYAHSLLTAMAATAPERDFLGYSHFGHWINDPASLAPLPNGLNVRDCFAHSSRESIMEAWQAARDTHQAPGGPDLVHSTSFQAPRFTKTKLVVTVFDLSFWAAPDFTTDRIRLDCQAGVLSSLEQADGLIFISEHARREFNKFIPCYQRRTDMATVVTPLASRWPTTQQASVQSGEYWLFVGSLEPRKNLENLLTAYECYSQGHPNPKPLWLAGGAGWKNEPIRARLERLEARGLARHLGYVPDHELKGLYHHAHALIFPSWYEGFGLPVLEAMTQGCPVICSDRASLPEVGGEAVHYIDPADPAAITQALVRLEQDSIYRSQLCERGRCQAARFSWANTAKLTLAFYDQILSAK